MLVGYIGGRVDQELNNPSQNLAITIRKTNPKPERLVEAFMCSLRIRERGLDRPLLVPLRPLRDSVENQIASVIHRLGRAQPVGVDEVRRHFVVYAKIVIPLLWQVTPQNEDIECLEDYLRGSKYSINQQRMMLNAALNQTHPESNEIKLSSFLKAEGYAPKLYRGQYVYKQARSINPYSTLLTSLLGPLFKQIDAFTMKNQENIGARFFVKGTDPSTWPKRMRDIFGRDPVIHGDFSSFESHHHDEFSAAVRFWMMHMMRHLVGARALREIVTRCVSGRNQMRFSKINVEADEVLMSGALWTSSSNAVLNLLMNSYMAATASGLRDPVEMAKWTCEEFKGLFEGDDGLTKDYGMDAAIAERLGVTLEWKRSENFSKAGFCSIVCHPELDLVVREPQKVLRNFFFLDARYMSLRESKKLGLLRAKAMSLLYLCPEAPVISPLCHKVLELTKSINLDYALAESDVYHRDFLNVAIAAKPWQVRRPITDEARQLCADAYNITAEEQLEIEHDIACVTSKNSVFDLSLSDMVDPLTYDHAYTHLVCDEKHFVPTAVPAHQLIQIVLDNHGWQGPLAERTHASRITENFDAVSRAIGPILVE